MLWLYADHDHYYSVRHILENFHAFEAAGGKGSLVIVRDLADDGHALLDWPEKWESAVSAYLAGIAPQ